jgi:hypothetical protein
MYQLGFPLSKISYSDLNIHLAGLVDDMTYFDLFTEDFIVFRCIQTHCSIVLTLNLVTLMLVYI